MYHPSCTLPCECHHLPTNHTNSIVYPPLPRSACRDILQIIAHKLGHLYDGPSFDEVIVNNVWITSSVFAYINCWKVLKTAINVASILGSSITKLETPNKCRIYGHALFNYMCFSSLPWLASHVHAICLKSLLRPIPDTWHTRIYMD